MALLADPVFNRRKRRVQIFSNGELTGPVSAQRGAYSYIGKTAIVRWKALAQQHPANLVPFACLGTFETSHRAADRKHDLKAYRERGFRGIRLYPQHHSYQLAL